MNRLLAIPQQSGQWVEDLHTEDEDDAYFDVDPDAPTGLVLALLAEAKRRGYEPIPDDDPHYDGPALLRDGRVRVHLTIIMEDI